VFFCLFVGWLGVWCCLLHHPQKQPTIKTFFILLNRGTHHWGARHEHEQRLVDESGFQRRSNVSGTTFSFCTLLVEAAALVEHAGTKTTTG